MIHAAFALLIAQSLDVSTLVEKYFSFIVLGLVLSVGYVFVRIYGPKKREQTEAQKLEDALREAQEELRARKAAGGAPPPTGLPAPKPSSSTSESPAGDRKPEE